MKVRLRNALHRVRRVLYADPKRNQRVGRRLVDISSEIGVLLVVFGPLELVLRQSQPLSGGVSSFRGSPSWTVGWMIFALGFTVIGAALFMDWRFLGND